MSGVLGIGNSQGVGIAQDVPKRFRGLLKRQALFYWGNRGMGQVCSFPILPIILQPLIGTSRRKRK